MGPYLSERQWGTVREDYSENGDAWNFFTHDHARSRAYRWGEDGIAGISDDKQAPLFQPGALERQGPPSQGATLRVDQQRRQPWRGREGVLLLPRQHADALVHEDLYKYPHAAFPYAALVETNRASQSSRDGVPSSSTQACFRTTAISTCSWSTRRTLPKTSSSASRQSTVGPTQPICICCRRCGFATTGRSGLPNRTELPKSRTSSRSRRTAGATAVAASHPLLGAFLFSCEGNVPLLFTENETNHERLFPGTGAKNESRYVKDGINEYVVHGRQDEVNPNHQGTKVSPHYKVNIGAGQSTVIRLRLSSSSMDQKGQQFGKPFDDVFAARLREADEFYKSVTPPSVNEDAANVMRQALAGMLWSKQFFFFDGDNWLDEHQSNPMHHGYRNARNSEWFHMLNRDIISMPDKWEYPWYAAWDLAFHTLPISIVDPDFAKDQMTLMLRGSYLHPNGQIPAYEWNFSDVNPPVHAFATLFLYRTAMAMTGRSGRRFPQGHLQQARAEFHLVGQPQGSLR